MRFAASLLVAAACVLASAPGLAITQPDGTIIPQRTDLQSLFDGRADPVSALTDAAILPATFVPRCSLTFTLVSRGVAQFHDVFGWYNASGTAPDPSDLHVLIPCDASPGFVATLDVTHEPAYRGGEIGFFLRTPQDNSGTGCAGADCCAGVSHTGYTYYSERLFNPDSTGPATSYIHLLVYDSRATPHAFYFAWEDLFQGGDNQFTDFVALVGGIVCSGAGGECDTGMMGVCAQGTQQCRSGALACVPVNTAHMEACDGLDNDCNGIVDDGMNLCPAGRVCDRGVCVDHCVEGSCFDGFTCSSQGVCVETACVGVPCPSGQRCMGGSCAAPCDGVVCPAGQACRVGRCLDPCLGVTCEADQVCVGGVCQTQCQCRGCAAAETCGTDGRCVATDCATVTCGAGQTCAAGHCLDACAGAVCPHGEVCRAGNCETAPVTGNDGGVDAGPSDAGSTDAAATDVTLTDTRMDTGVLGTPRPGCRCRIERTGSRNMRGVHALSALAIATLASARRRRRSR